MLTRFYKCVQCKFSKMNSEEEPASSAYDDPEESASFAYDCPDWQQWKREKDRLARVQAPQSLQLEWGMLEPNPLKPRRSRLEPHAFQCALGARKRQRLHEVDGAASEDSLSDKEVHYLDRRKRWRLKVPKRFPYVIYSMRSAGAERHQMLQHDKDPWGEYLRTP